MKITITAEGGSSETLCDHGREAPDSLTPVPLRKVDVLEFVQGLFAKPKNRGNTLNQLTFTSSREHDSATSAQIYMFRRNDVVPCAGTLDIELEDRITHIEALNATVEFTPLPLFNVRTTIAYTIKYGRINMVYQAVPWITADGKQKVDANGKVMFVRKEIL